MRLIYCYFSILPFAAVSCVSSGTYKALQQDKQKTDSLYTWSMQTLRSSQADNARLNREKAALRDSANDMSGQLSAVRENNRVLHKQLDDLSAISSAQAESIRKSLDNIGAKDLYLQRLRTALSRRDSVNLAVLMELKAALGSFSDTLVGIRVEKGVVRVEVANPLLFGDGGGDTVTDKGRTLLVRLARVLRDQPDVGCRVEAYPDSSLSAGVDSAAMGSVGMSGGSGGGSVGTGAGPVVGSGSWDRDGRRASSVVRTLQDQYRVAAARMVAAAKGEPGRGTRILLIPPGGELSEVLEKR
jgi:chemotaxis protein MotB